MVRGSRFISEIKLLQELSWNYLSVAIFAKFKLTQTPEIIYNKFFIDLPTNVGE